MDETQSAADADSGGLSPEGAFAILGDETRLEIIRVLWRTGALTEYDDVDDSASIISFSELRRRTGVDDNGRFNYHLSKLVPHFVRKTDEGYRLSGGGKRIARTVIAVTGDHDAAVVGDVEADCPACGGAIAATYEDQWLRFACTECAGLFGDAAPYGTLLNAPFPAPGLADRTASDALTTELYRCMLDLTPMMHGVCPECASVVEGTLATRDDHDARPDELCRTCRTPFEAWGELRCGTCRFAKRLPVELCVLSLPPVIGFLYARDTNVLAPSLDDLFDLVRTRTATTVGRAPLTATVTLTAATDELTVRLDERLAVLTVSVVTVGDPLVATVPPE